MNGKQPVPLCKAFLPCKQLLMSKNGVDTALMGLPRSFTHHVFPAATPLGFFARLSSAHGEYQVEVQLVSMDGEVVWRDGPPEPLKMDDPLKLYDVRMKTCVAIPKPGQYDLVLMTNGEEVARQPFAAHLATKTAKKP